MGLFDRFRRSSRTEPEKDTGRSSAPSRTSASSARKSGDSGQGGSLSSDQEVLNAIAAIWEHGPSAVTSTPTPEPSDDDDGEPDVAKALRILLGEDLPEQKDEESESSYEEDVNDAIDTVVGLMRERPEAADLQARIRQYAEEHSTGEKEEPEPEPEPEPATGEEPAADLLAGIAALMGQGQQEPEAAAEPEPEPVSASDTEHAADLLSSISALIGQGPAEPEPEPEPEPSAKSSQASEPSSDDNPFSAIAALMGQGDPEPEPADEPTAASASSDGDDLLSSIAALMGGSMYASDQDAAETPAKPAIDPALEEEFATLCAESDRFKDQGALSSSQAKNLQACSLCEESAALKGMAYSRAASFALHHLGDGFDAADFSRMSLECGDEFRAYAKERAADGQPNAHMESLQIAAMTSTSYDEALEYADQGVELYGDDFGDMAEELRRFRAEHPRYADYQRDVSLRYYSRVSAEEDKGDYAPAMALLDLMLRHAKNDGYELSYAEQAQILDDYGTISIMHLLGKARSSGLSQDDFAEELSFIVDWPLYRIADFLPECQPAEKQKIDRIIQGMKMLPGVSERVAFEPFK